MHAGISIHQLSPPPPGPARALRHRSNEMACARSRSLPGLRALGTSPGVLQVWGSQTAWLVCSELLNFVPEPSDSAWEDFGGAM